ncbi:cytochrome c-type biogenesis protein [Pantoea sp. BAV 3049]|uniref:cytochrome c-type biogenesis protein n=1 Tax=Pantoea sp. BAV 3049 TaxID=2654188 RepID=UPI00131D54EF|nr:cytochrome c-type biogenesis protein [Pantoea sp. BAV 3049]
MKRCLILLATLLLAFSALADNIDTYKFSSVDQEQQYRHLTGSLRCPKCQNNSIADSNAMIAGDMRLKVYELLQSGQTPDQVKAYMVARYGNFVTYEPPVLPSTLILWAGPALFVIVGALVIILRSRKRKLTGSDLDTEQQARLDALLKNNGKRS